MKKLLTFLSLACMIIISSCSDDDKLLVTEGSFGSLITPNTGDSFVLNPFDDANNTAITFSWNDAQYSVATGVNYAVQLAAVGTNFAEPVLAGNTTSNTLTLSTAVFNGFTVQLGLLPFTEGQLEFRVMSTIGDGTLPQYSEVRTINVTPYTTDSPKLAVPGNHQGWDPPTAPIIAAPAFGDTNYSGYVWLDGEYKFLAPDLAGDFAWGNTDWGDDGAFAGVLVEQDEVNCNAPVAGYYLVEANTADLTYSATLHNWGIIGNATPTGWDSDTDMTYDPATMTLTITMDLVAQAAPDNGLKFRVNDDWGINLGDDGADGTLEYNGQNIGVAESGNYTIVLNLSNPDEFTYTLTLN